MRAYTANMIPGGTTPTINVSQYDNDYAVTVTLIEGAEIYTPPVGATIRVEGTKPDGLGFEYPCTYQGNVVTMPIYTQMTVVSGRFPIELVVYQSGLRVGSCNIIFAVEKAPLGEDTDISETVIPDIIDAAQASAQAAQEAAETAQEAAAEVLSSQIVTSASGSVATFTDGANDVAIKSLTATITPVQSGSGDGDPSPSNIRPISGRTGLTVTRLGKNILDPSYMVRGSVFVDNGNGTYTFSKAGTGASGRITWSAPVVADNGTTVTFSADITGTHESEIYFGFALDETTSGATVVCTIANGRITGTITSTAYMNGLRLYWRNNSTGVGTDSVVLSNMQVEYGSTVTAYEPYTKQTYPVTWETEAGTVYGGTLNVTTGVLTVDRVCVTFTENDAWTGTGSVSGGSLRYYVIVPVAPDTTKSGTTTMCSCAVYLTGNNGAWGTYNYNTNSGAFFIKNGDGGAGFTSLDDFKAWLSTHTVQLCYYIAEPTTYQLTPTEIKTLLGGNTIYTDAGSVSVEYVADTKLYIDNKIAELQALVLEN